MKALLNLVLSATLLITVKSQTCDIQVLGTCLQSAVSEWPSYNDVLQQLTQGQIPNVTPEEISSLCNLTTTLGECVGNSLTNCTRDQALPFELIMSSIAFVCSTEDEFFDNNMCLSDPSFVNETSECLNIGDFSISEIPPNSQQASTVCSLLDGAMACVTNITDAYCGTRSSDYMTAFTMTLTGPVQDMLGCQQIISGTLDNPEVTTTEQSLVTKDTESATINSTMSSEYITNQSTNTSEPQTSTLEPSVPEVEPVSSPEATANETANAEVEPLATAVDLTTTDMIPTLPTTIETSSEATTAAPIKPVTNDTMKPTTTTNMEPTATSTMEQTTTTTMEPTTTSIVEQTTTTMDPTTRSTVEQITTTMEPSTTSTMEQTTTTTMEPSTTSTVEQTTTTMEPSTTSAVEQTTTTMEPSTTSTVEQTTTTMEPSTTSTVEQTTTTMEPSTTSTVEQTTTMEPSTTSTVEQTTTTMEPSTTSTVEQTTTTMEPSTTSTVEQTTTTMEPKTTTTMEPTTTSSIKPTTTEQITTEPATTVSIMMPSPDLNMEPISIDVMMDSPSCDTTVIAQCIVNSIGSSPYYSQMLEATKTGVFPQLSDNELQELCMSVGALETCLARESAGCSGAHLLQYTSLRHTFNYICNTGKQDFLETAKCFAKPDIVLSTQSCLMIPSQEIGRLVSMVASSPDLFMQAQQLCSLLETTKLCFINAANIHCTRDQAQSVLSYISNVMEPTRNFFTCPFVETTLPTVESNSITSVETTTRDQMTPDDVTDATTIGQPTTKQTTAFEEDTTTNQMIPDDVTDATAVGQPTSEQTTAFEEDTTTNQMMPDDVTDATAVGQPTTEQTTAFEEDTTTNQMMPDDVTDATAVGQPTTEQTTAFEEDTTTNQMIPDDVTDATAVGQPTTEQTTAFEEDTTIDQMIPDDVIDATTAGQPTTDMTPDVATTSKQTTTNEDSTSAVIMTTTPPPMSEDTTTLNPFVAETTTAEMTTTEEPRLCFNCRYHGQFVFKEEAVSEKIDQYCIANGIRGFCPIDTCRCEDPEYAVQVPVCEVRGLFRNVPGYKEWCERMCHQGYCQIDPCDCHMEASRRSDNQLA